MSSLHTHSKEEPPLTATRESPCTVTEDPVQSKWKNERTLKKHLGDSLIVQWLGLPLYMVGDLCLISVWGTKIKNRSFVPSGAGRINWNNA